MATSRRSLSRSHPFPPVNARSAAVLQAKDEVIRAAIRRLTQPAKGATYTPAELVVLLNQSDARVPIKNQTRALTLCLENKVRPKFFVGK